ncbi:pilus assembly protein [Azotobacter chroococcum]|uniref:Pilus assembly protein n=1 Tax=Azotobacter chroococcum TaxID=353 RepID=A0AA43Z7V0_9GAMM|nr:TadE/TadG family type IV pilus assembly protein [Azotobacter chroococcum]NHN78012.1 pilus assembly protein [Azotobacter chroococcum]
MVEFAISVPILLLLLLAMGEVGRMLSQYNVLLQSSRDAVRYAAHHAWNSTTGAIDRAKVQGVVENLAVYGSPAVQAKPLIYGLGAGNVVFSDDGVDHVQVTIRYTFVPAVGNVLPGFFGRDIPLGVELVATTVMRVL